MAFGFPPGGAAQGIDGCRRRFFYAAAQAIWGCSGHNLGLFGGVVWAWLAQKLQDLQASFLTPSHSGDFDGQDRRRRDEHGERERSQVC
jgi:hypothetical protein